MTCKYYHDNEIFENYLLNRLSQTERSDFDIHLETCEECRTKLEKEKLLFIGLREIGKQEMKDEIRRQVLSKQREKTSADWGIILKVAAVILFAVITPSLIYYYQYMTPELVQYSMKEKAPAMETETGQSRTEPEEQELPGRRHVLAEDASVNDAKKGQLRVEASDQALKKRSISPAEEIPASGDVLAVSETVDENRADREIQKEEPAVPQQGVPAEEMDLMSRGKIAPALAHEGQVLHYEKDTALSISRDQKSTYYQRQTLSELTQTQKTWQFRQASQNIILQLQLRNDLVLKNEKFPEKTPAQVIRQDSLETMIQWQVPPEIYNLDPNQVTLYLSDSKTLQIKLPANVSYRIDLEQRLQEAVQVSP